MKKLLRDNGLAISLGFLFLLFWAAQAVAGFKVYNEDAARHGQAVIDFGGYLLSGQFWEATGENWESEFLQMGAYIIMTSMLFQKGSAESNDPDEPQSTSALHSKKHSWLYRNSLSLAFLGLFAASLIIHAEGGL